MNRMKKRVKVAVTGVGGGVGQSIIKALQKTEYVPIGIDSEVLGTGLYMTPKSYLGLYADNPKYIDRLVEICKKEDCQALFPGTDAELASLAVSRDRFISEGIIPVVSSEQIIEIADDKLKTAEFLKRNKFPYIKTCRLVNYNSRSGLSFPLILKPQKGGRRSVGVFTAYNSKEIREYKSKVDLNNYIVQEQVSGDEYTCGTVSFDNGCVGVILMKRILRCGDTYKAFVVENRKLSDYIRKVVNVLRPFGALNVQFRLRSGVPYIFEFNARCSGTTAARALAGFNEPKMICDFLFKNESHPKFRIKRIAVFRYWNELVVGDKSIKDIERRGFTKNKMISI